MLVSSYYYYATIIVTPIYVTGKKQQQQKTAKKQQTKTPGGMGGKNPLIFRVTKVYLLLVAGIPYSKSTHWPSVLHWLWY